MSCSCLKRLSAILALILFPGLAIAEVSVQLNRDGSFRKVVYLTRGTGPRAVVWGQIRGRIPLEQMLNPLGDNFGDLRPFITRHPETGDPWVIWSMSVANQKRIGFALWTGKNWTAPRPVVPVPGPMYYDQLDPVLAFDASGTPYLVWWQIEPVAKVYFSTLLRGTWTPPLLISDPAKDSRGPSVLLQGSNLAVTYTTSAGRVTTTRSTGVLIQSAAQLMDSPIPPGNSSSPGAGGSPGDKSELPLIRR